MEETAASNETGPKEEKEELRDRTCHSRTEKPAGAPWGKKWSRPGREDWSPVFCFIQEKGEDRKEEGSGESSPREERDKDRNGDELARSICSLVAVSINNIKTLYDEKHDKATFVKNIILDNILPGDIYIKSRELHFGNDVPRVVFLVRQQAPADVAAIDVVNGMFPDKQKDFVLHISETDIVVVKEVKAGSEIKDLIKLADSIEETLLSELSVKCLIGIGSVSSQMKDIAKSSRRLRPQSRSVRYLTPRRTSSASRIWALAV